MASRGETWQARIRRKLAGLPRPADARARLRERIVGEPSAELEARLEQPAREAAVLVGLIERPGDIHILLTRRADHLPHHPGQIALPGGRLMALESPETAAVREAEEEVGLAGAQVDLLGCLPARLTGTGFEVTPVVGWLAADFEPVPDPSEVDAAFEVPVGHLLAPGTRRRCTRTRWGTRFLTDEYHFGRHRIWGATATILTDFLEVIDEKTI